MTALRLARLQVKAAQERLPAPADATRRRCAIWLSCKADRFRAIRPVALRSRPVPTVIALFVPACPRHLLPTLARSYGWFGYRDRRWPAFSRRACRRFLTTCAG